VTGLYSGKGGQLTMFSGAKGTPESHANRGMDFETALNEMHELYEARGVAQIRKQYVPSLPVKDGKWAKVIGKSTVDYVGQLGRGRFVAFDAKDCAEKRISLERLQDHQLRFLEYASMLGGLAFILVRFGRRTVYMIPVEAWRWAVEAHRAGHSVYVESLGWTATGKASINIKELPAEWRVDGYDWAAALRRYDFERVAGAQGEGLRVRDAEGVGQGMGHASEVAGADCKRGVRTEP